MKRELIISVFASLQGLEKRYSQCQELLSERKFLRAIVREELKSEEEVLGAMRRAANRLQLELASDNWTAAGRSLNIFRGLHQMIHPQIHLTFGKLNRRNPNAGEMEVDLEFEPVRASVH